ncbi:MAG TPA: hypothetical protein H9736_05985 [Candidatus Anaerotruncus excrementipullorum]|uniref:Uncharacterized protein n=1 Tax=Candidatus Anaerotruncus excrementipullorum TaxID=2838465 RepID=A0A9D1WRD0_9FIRM|nr:hypothetical protein [Candidatus Anaerotruncus excrementipullorum]
MRRIGLAIGLALLFLAGCGSGGKGAPQAPSRQSLHAAPGEYVHEDRTVEERYWPTLVLEEDGSFTFTVNLLSSMGQITGQYTAQDQKVVLTVGKLDFQGFLGDDVKLIYFDVASEDSLLFRGTDTEEPIGMTEELDLFTRREK